MKMRMITGREGVVSTLGRVLASNDSWRMLWRGTGISLLGVLDGAIQFMMYEQLKFMWSDERNMLSVWGQLAAGGASRIVAIIATYPYQLLRSVLQQQGSPYSSCRCAFQKVTFLNKKN